MRDDILLRDEAFDHVPTKQLLAMLHNSSRLVRARALATLARRSGQDEALVDQIIDAIRDPKNTEARLLGSTVSVSHIGFAGLWAFGTPRAKLFLKDLLQHWPEPDREDLLWFLESQSLSMEPPEKSPQYDVFR